MEVQELTVEYSGVKALDRVNMRIEGPGLVQVIGPNGSGKTSLLRAILGLVKPSRGRIVIEGIDVTGSPRLAGRMAGYVPQRPGAPRLSPVTVLELVETSLRMRGHRDPRGLAEDALDAAGVGREHWGKRLWELSGGTLQRVFIARATAPGPRLLVMDEPLANIDPGGRLGLAKLIARLSRDRLVIVASHEPNLLLPYTRYMVLVDRGVVAQGPPSQVFRKHVLERVYGASVTRGLVLAGEEGAHG